MFRYRLRTLLIVLAVGPPVLWLGWLGTIAVKRHMEHGYISGSTIVMVILWIAAAIYLFVPPPRIE